MERLFFHRLLNSGKVFAFGFCVSTERFLEVKNGGLDVKIGKDRLKKIIEEEVSLFVEVEKKKKKKMSDGEARRKNTEQKRKARFSDELRWGHESIRQLARGIAEQNPYRGSDGHFSNKKGAATYSTYFVDGVRRNLRGSTKSVKNSGRGPNNTQGKYRLKDGSPKWEEGKEGSEEIRFSITMKDLSGVVEDCVAEFVRQFGEKHKEQPEVMEDGESRITMGGGGGAPIPD